MHGVTVVMDDNGTEADRFGALTSGHTVLYSRGGKLWSSAAASPWRAGMWATTPASEA